MKMTISQWWGLAVLSLSCGLFLAGFISDLRISAIRRRRREREQKDALGSGAILAHRKGGDM
jgi:hypothetical protein